MIKVASGILVKEAFGPKALMKVGPRVIKQRAARMAGLSDEAAALLARKTQDQVARLAAKGDLRAAMRRADAEGLPFARAADTLGEAVDWERAGDVLHRALERSKPMQSRLAGLVPISAMPVDRFRGLEFYHTMPQALALM